MSRKKQICVIGLGHFGNELALSLAEDSEVLALDISDQKVNDAAGQVQRALCLDARDFTALSSVVSPDFDEAIVSMGENLEASILCTLHLSRIGVPVIRAKAVSEDHASILRMVGASYTIFPERETARRVAAEILNPNMLDFVPLEGEYLVRDVTFPPALHGISLGQLNLRALLDVFVLAVRRQTEPRFTFLPGPGYVNVPGDVMVMIGRGADLEKIEKMTEPPPPPMPPPCNETPAP